MEHNWPRIIEFLIDQISDWTRCWCLHTLPEWSSPLQTITDQESSDLSLAPSENNDNPLCFAYTNIITNSDILFLGSLNPTCSLQVTARPGTRIQLLKIPVRNVSKEPAFSTLNAMETLNIV